MDRAILPQQDQITSVAGTFNLPIPVAMACAMGTDGVFGYDHLVFGKLYRVTEDIASNDGDHLATGERVHFMGAVPQPHSGGVDLYFDVTGQQRALRFNPDAPQEPDKRRYLRNAQTVLRPVLIDLSKRRKQLVTARAVLLHLRKQQEA